MGFLCGEGYLLEICQMDMTMVGRDYTNSGLSDSDYP